RPPPQHHRFRGERPERRPVGPRRLLLHLPGPTRWDPSRLRQRRGLARPGRIDRSRLPPGREADLHILQPAAAGRVSDSRADPRRLADRLGAGHAAPGRRRERRLIVAGAGGPAPPTPPTPGPPPPRPPRGPPLPPKARGRRGA